MADISKLTRLLNGVQRQVDLSTNTLVTNAVKVGGSAGTDLTKTILDKLVAMQGVADADGSYDSRYFTESELGDSTASSGSDLIGDDDTYSNFTPAAATVKGALSGIDDAISTAGSTSFSDAEFELFDDGDNTKKLVYQLSGLSTSTTRTITAADADVNLADVNNAILKDGSRAFTANQSMGGNKLTNLGAPTQDGDAATKSYVDSIEQGLDLKDSVRAASTANVDLTVAGDGTLDGVTLADGDRVLLKDQSTASENGIYDAATAADRTTWTRSADADEDSEVTAGMFTFVEEGTSNADSGWVLTTDDPITVGTTGLSFTQFSGAGQITAGDALSKSGNTLNVNVDGATIEVTSDALNIVDGGVNTTQLADDAVTASKIAASVAGLGITQATGGELDVNVDDSTLEIATDTVQVKDGGITDAKAASGSNLEEAVNFFGATDLTGSEAEQLSDGSNADSLHEHAILKKPVTVGEAVAADTSFLVRWAVDGETAGRVYKATNDTSTSDLFYAVGIINGGGSGLSAGGTTTMTMLGSYSLAASDSAFATADVGKPVYLGASGAFTTTAPTATDTAVYRAGIVEDTSTIYFGNTQVNGVN